MDVWAKGRPWKPTTAPSPYGKDAQRWNRDGPPARPRRTLARVQCGNRKARDPSSDLIQIYRLEDFLCHSGKGVVGGWPKGQ